jgi:alkylated DNA repair dioxygenase AlkB
MSLACSRAVGGSEYLRAVTTAADDRTWVQGTLERQWLDDTSWIDVGRGWLAAPEEVYSTLRDTVDWQENKIWTYDHYRTEPRLMAGCRPGMHAPHPAITEIHKTLRRHYGVELMGVGMSYYRDGRDAMGAHRDTDLRHCEETLIAIVSLGVTRPWTLTRHNSRVPALDLAPGPGDVVVMGGRAQADWLHGVPPARGVRDGRISLQWRWTSGRGRPERGGGSQAPRMYGGGR